MRATAVLGRITAVALPLTLAVSCVVGDEEPIEEQEPDDVGVIAHDLDDSIERGRDIWFENTYGGEKFFSFLQVHPDPQKRIKIGFEEVLNTPRAARFDVWGVINDPDCTADPNGGPDICPNPTASGVVGIRKFPGPGGTTMFGVACAACHAGFDPVNPPADPNAPTWDNIHATIGNQYMKFGAIFGANLAPTDPRALIFGAWPDGAVDTTLLFSDGIMNPGVVTAFWEHKNRNRFDVGDRGHQLRNGQGGEDDVGDLAAVRVYTNIGACFFECTAPAVAAGTELDIEACKQSCPDYPPQQDLDDMTNFLASFDRPRYPGYPTLPFLYWAGKAVFNDNCESCHDRDGDLRRVLSNDEVNPLVADPANATNACRALTDQWEAGRLWGQFSSQLYKDRAAAGNKGYRTMPLGGIWSTSPYLHNQSIGTWAPADATPRERTQAYWESMWELLSSEREPKINVTPIDLPGIAPAGTPLHYIFSRDPATGELLCDDVVENRGHYYGADLNLLEKVALIYWLKYQ